MRFIFILIIGLFLFQAPSANAADPAGLNTASQEKKKKKKSRRVKAMSQELSKRMNVLHQKQAAKDFEGIITVGAAYLSAKAVDFEEIYFVNQMMGLASLEMNKSEASLEYLIKAYEAGKELSPWMNKGIILFIAQISFSLDEYNETLRWYNKYEEAYGPIQGKNIAFRVRAFYHLGRFDEAKGLFTTIYNIIDPGEWYGGGYKLMLKAAIQTQDRVYLFKLAEKIQEANAGVTIEEAIVILEDVETPLDMSFVEKMKTKKVEKKKVDAPKIKQKPGEFLPLVIANPEYPKKAVKNKICGYVIAEFTVTKKGTVEKIKIIESKPKKIFDKAAKNALKQYRYEPRVVNGKKADAKGIKTKMIFKLDPGCKE